MSYDCTRPSFTDAPQDDLFNEMEGPGLLGALPRVTENLNEDMRSMFLTATLSEQPATMADQSRSTISREPAPSQPSQGSGRSLPSISKDEAAVAEAVKRWKAEIVGMTVDKQTGADFYTIRVSRGEQVWSASRRYREFDELSKKLLGDARKHMPPKAVFRRRCSSSFPARRQQGLQEFLKYTARADPQLQGPALREFLQVPPEPAPTIVSVKAKIADSEVSKNIAAMQARALDPAPQTEFNGSGDEALAELIVFEDAPPSSSREGAAVEVSSPSAASARSD